MQQRLINVPEWHEFAACRSRQDLNWIEAWPGDDAEACKAVCRCCPVRLICAITALSAAEQGGVWGGLDADDRAALARESGQGSLPDLPPQGEARDRAAAAPSLAGIA
ncbi:WhiB family transcriptional regulator [Lentzea alba]|uniref:WhiB family transcriptional regulator n=1 Tax=Lentzea alba TaxID=2714351 RepID=UPI0039BF7EDE